MRHGTAHRSSMPRRAAFLLSNLKERFLAVKSAVILKSRPLKPSFPASKEGFNPATIFLNTI